MPLISRPGAEIYFEIIGDSPNLITLINGHMREHTDFRALSKQLVQSGYQCLTLDNRGVGQSHAEASFTLQDMTDDILAIWQELGITKSHILGISMGGVIAQKLAHQASQHCQSLCLISTYNHPEQINQENQTDWQAEEAFILKKLSAYVTEDFFNRNRLLMQAMAKQMSQKLRQASYLQGAKSQRNALKEISPAELSIPGDIPVLVIHGKQDRIIPVKAAQEIASSINQAEVNIIDNAGHLLLAESPKNLYPLIIDFLDSCH